MSAEAGTTRRGITAPAAPPAVGPARVEIDAIVAVD
jgi:hypothetical protein